MFYENLKVQRLYRWLCANPSTFVRDILCSNPKSFKHNQTIEQADTKTCDLWRYKF